MTCPKCKAKVGVVNQEIILDHSVVSGCRCIICGYWKFDHKPKSMSERTNQTN
jgi:hypothetical protein